MNMKNRFTFCNFRRLQSMNKCLLLFVFCFLLPAGVFAQPVTLDPTFGENGITVLPVEGGIYSFNYDASGNIIAVGTTTDTNYPVIIKTDANGIIDENFGTNGVITLGYKNSRIWDSKITTDNKILHTNAIVFPWLTGTILEL